MQKKPLVSVNITTHNRSGLLIKCLDSVLSQSYDNMEIIIVDDFSTDNTEEVVRRYQKKFTNIKYIKHKENLQLSKARNTAWKSSNGKYIAFMDDDDIWIDEDKIKKQVDIFEGNNEKLALISTSVRLYSNPKRYKDKIIEKPLDLKNHILSKNGIMYTSAVMTKKEVVKKVGGFDIKLQRGVDSDFYRTCIMRYGFNVYFMKDLTSAICEYGEDRITPQKTFWSRIKSIKSELYTIKKYNFLFIKYPVALFRRIKKIIILLILIVLDFLRIRR